MTTATSPQRIRVCDANNDEWLDERSRGIGASEAAAACGLSRWALPIDIWDRKVNGTRVEENDAMLAGTMLEPVLAVLLEQSTGLKVTEFAPGLYRHPEHEWMLASPDAWLENGELAELKSTTTRNDELGDEDTDEVPLDWLCQAQQQMAVCGADRVHFMVIYRDLVPLGWLLKTHAALARGEDVDLSGLDASRWTRHYIVDRNDGLIAGIVKRERRLWQHVIDKVPPDVDLEHNRAAEAIRRAFRSVKEGETVELGEDLESLWERYMELGKQEKEVEEEREKINARVRLAMKDAQTGVFPSGAKLKRTIVKGGLVSYHRSDSVKITYSKAKS